MTTRKTPLVNDECYHVYLRGVEKRKIVLDTADIEHFLFSVNAFNTTERIGSIYEHSFHDPLGSSTSK